MTRGRVQRACRAPAYGSGEPVYDAFAHVITIQ